MSVKKVLIFGSKGLVGSSCKRIFLESGNYDVFASTRDDTNLFDYASTKNLIDEYSPDFIINCAAKVGGILANNNQRTEFILENLKININIFESCIKNPNIAILQPSRGENSILEKKLCEFWGIDYVLCRESGSYSQKNWERTISGSKMKLFLVKRPKLVNDNSYSFNQYQDLINHIIKTNIDV